MQLNTLSTMFANPSQLLYPQHAASFPLPLNASISWQQDSIPEDLPDSSPCYVIKASKRQVHKDDTIVSILTST